MTNYTATEAIVKDGKIYPLEPAKLPKEGRLLLVVLDKKKAKPDFERIEKLLGWFKTDRDGVQWEKQFRSEWDHRL
jgi:hypothetical protein